MLHKDPSFNMLRYFKFLMSALWHLFSSIPCHVRVWKRSSPGEPSALKATSAWRRGNRGNSSSVSSWRLKKMIWWVLNDHCWDANTLCCPFTHCRSIVHTFSYASILFASHYAQVLIMPTHRALYSICACMRIGMTHSHILYMHSCTGGMSLCSLNTSLQNSVGPVSLRVSPVPLAPSGG